MFVASVALQRPDGRSPAGLALRHREQRVGHGRRALRRQAGRVSPAYRKCSRVYREAQLAGFLANPQRAVETAERTPKAKDNRELLPLLSYLATDEDRVSRLILNTLGMWRVDVEDIDF